MATFSYVGPYSSKMANWIEAFLALSTLLLLLVAMPDITSEPVVPALAASLPANSTSADPCSHSVYIAPRVVFTTVCYYAPLLVLLLILVVTATTCFWYVRKLRIG